jgi:hypothetical protein
MSERARIKNTQNEREAQDDGEEDRMRGRITELTKLKVPQPPWLKNGNLRYYTVRSTNCKLQTANRKYMWR